MKEQREALQDIAARIERGEELTDFEREYAAAALRHVAQGIPDLSPPRRKPGGQTKADPAQLAIEFAALCIGGTVNRTEAVQQLADRFGYKDQRQVWKVLEDYRKSLKPGD